MKFDIAIVVGVLLFLIAVGCLGLLAMWALARKRARP